MSLQQVDKFLKGRNCKPIFPLKPTSPNRIRHRIVTLKVFDVGSKLSWDLNLLMKILDITHYYHFLKIFLKQVWKLASIYLNNR